MDSSKNSPKIYLQTLENLYCELKQARAMSSCGRRFALLGLLFDVHRAHQLFLDIKMRLSNIEYSHDLLLYDADVDYNQWCIDFDIKFDVNPYYLPEEEEDDLGATQIKQTLWDILDSFPEDMLKKEKLERTSYQEHIEASLTADIQIDHLVILLNESIKNFRGTLGSIQAVLNSHKVTLDNGGLLYEQEEAIFKKECYESVLEDFNNWKEYYDDDESLLQRNIKGLYSTEMMQLFMTDFFKPRIVSQQGTDTHDYEEEMSDLIFYNVPKDINIILQYSALRELFDYSNGYVTPKYKHIGRYFYKHRKAVTQEKRIALFRFITMVELLRELSAPKRVQRVVVHTSDFASIIQYADKAKLLARLHDLIDGNRGAAVGAVLMQCKNKGYITGNPTQAQFTSEFELKGTWKAIHNYLDDNNQTALDKANRIVIFEGE